MNCENCGDVCVCGWLVANRIRVNERTWFVLILFQYTFVAYENYSNSLIPLISLFLFSLANEHYWNFEFAIGFGKWRGRRQEQEEEEVTKLANLLSNRSHTIRAAIFIPYIAHQPNEANGNERTKTCNYCKYLIWSLIELNQRNQHYSVERSFILTRFGTEHDTMHTRHHSIQFGMPNVEHFSSRTKMFWLRASNQTRHWCDAKLRGEKDFCLRKTNARN